jgi:flagellar motor switch protein FliG
MLHPLDRRQQTLLLTTLAFGGSQASELWQLLPDEQQAPLAEKQQKLDEIPREKRVPLMVRELKGLMSFRSVKGLDGVEPSWLAAGFKGESPRVIAAVLMYLPSSLTKQIVARLPEAVQKALPAREEMRGVPLEVIKLVRSRFDAKFIAMPLEGDLASLAFSNLVLLSAKELIVLIRNIGADEIACAFLAVGKRALAEFLSKLAPQDGEELIAAVRRADVKDGMELKSAQAFLGKVLSGAPPQSQKVGPNTGGIPRASGNTSGIAFANTDELFQKAGIYRLARAIVVDDPLVIRQIVQRFPRAHGRLLLEYIDRVKEREIEEAQVRRLRDQILDVLVNLSRRGKIDQRFGAVPTQFETR